MIRSLLDFPGSSDGKESACSVGDPGSTPELGRSPGEENGYPLQCSCLENPMDRGAWGATVHGVAKSWTRLSDSTHLRWPQCCRVISHYKKRFPDLPGDPVVEKPHFLCRGHVCVDEENLEVQ